MLIFIRIVLELYKLKDINLFNDLSLKKNMNSVERLVYNTRKTSEAIILAYSPSFPLEIKEGTSFYIPDYYKVCDNLERGIQKISQKSSIEKRIAKGLRCL